MFSDMLTDVNRVILGDAIFQWRPGSCKFIAGVGGGERRGDQDMLQEVADREEERGKEANEPKSSYLSNLEHMLHMGGGGRRGDCSEEQQEEDKRCCGAWVAHSVLQDIPANSSADMQPSFLHRGTFAGHCKVSIPGSWWAPTPAMVQATFPLWLLAAKYDRADQYRKHLARTRKRDRDTRDRLDLDDAFNRSDVAHK